MDRKVAVVGGSGVVGRAILEDLTAAGVPYVALSRRPPDLLPASEPRHHLGASQIRVAARTVLRKREHGIL